MNENEFISVSEFAKRVNLSRQAVYKRVDKDLTPFVNHDLQTGQKTIDIKALKLFDSLQSTTVNKANEVDNPVDSKEIRLTHDRVSKVDENLTLLIETLQSKLEEKDKQIDELKNEKKELKEELKHANEHSRNLSSDLVELNRNQQILLKQSQDKVLELEAPPEKKSWFKRK